MRLYYLISFLICSLLTLGHAQDTATNNFYKEISKYDLSVLWVGDSVKESKNKNFKRPEPIGFIGDSFQRFYIHFISIAINPQRPYEYNVYGKTKIKNNIRSIHGTITVKSADTVRMAGNDRIERLMGWVVCNILFYEDKKQPASGFIKGRFESNFYFDKEGILRYDDLDIEADDYSNNQFVGTWTGYKTIKSKKCNWGDYRIPECGDLDTGAGAFIPNKKYLKFGWDSHTNAWDFDPDKPETKQPGLKEKQQWWK